ncbi:MAG: hypothetical protein ACRD1E_12905, partial [Terriglobales bacterium]
EFRAERNPADELRSQTALMRALRQQHRRREAGEIELEAAALGAASPDPGLTLPLVIEAARLEPAAAARGNLQRAIGQAHARGYVLLEYQARLAQAELSLPAAPARAQLAALARQAGARGLGRLQAQADALLH